MKGHEDLTIQQKFGLGVFILIAGATFVFGIVSLRKSIILPLFRPENYFTIKTAEQLEEERLLELRKQDMDSDGVSDYEELYVFRTSPFLEDSDSDGIFDGEEIVQQTDPNCPRGKSCGTTGGSSQVTVAPAPAAPALVLPTVGTAPPAAAGTTLSATEDDIAKVIVETFGDVSSLSPEMIAEKLEAMPPDELRAFLTKLGIPQDLLAGTDDATIRALLQQTLAEIGQGGLTQ